MAVPNIESLFDIHRIHNQDFLKVLLYFPVGLVLLVLRLAVILLAWPFLAFLPKASILRSVLLKAVCFSFGIFVKKRDTHFINERVKLMVCNHISILDHVAVESVLTCFQVNICSHFCAEWDFPAYTSERRIDGRVPRDKLDLMQHYINVYDAPVLVYPEGDTTNGKRGLLKFSSSPFVLSTSVQPVVVQIPHTSFINIAPSVIGANDWCELLWLLFVPYTVFNLRVLPVVCQREMEPTERFCKRVQDIMAKSLNLTSTEYTSHNKAELERHLNVSSVPQPSTSHSAHSHPRNVHDLNRMAEQVKEVLPNVPFDVILKDLRRTRNVDDTIFRIIEGVVHFVAEESLLNSPSTSSAPNFPSTSTSSTPNFPSTSSALNFPSTSGTLNFPSTSGVASSSRVADKKPAIPPANAAAAEKFGKTAKDRMQSYQERKAAFIQMAKLKYLEKHPELET